MQDICTIIQQFYIFRYSCCKIEVFLINNLSIRIACIDFVIKEVERHASSTKINMWSDGCAAQFRSHFVFKLLVNFCRDLQLEWNYNQAHHGKDPLDGIGETIKNVVFRQVKSSRVIINSAEEFSVAANNCSAVNCNAISQRKRFALRTR